MLKVGEIGAIYCLACGDDKEGVLISLEDRHDLRGSECEECGKVIA